VRLARLIRRRIAVKLTLTLLAFVGVSILVAGLYLNRALEAFAVDSLEARLVLAGSLLEDDARRLLLDPTSADQLRDFVSRASARAAVRITLIATDGQVLADSEVGMASLPNVENHAGRPEVRRALAGERGHSVRTSATIHEALFYVGMPVRDGDRIVGVLRLALPLSVVTSSYAVLHRVMVAGGVLALAVAAGIGVFVAGRITRPVVEMQRTARRMSDGNFDVRAPVRSVDEIGALGTALNVMAVRLRDKIEDLEAEQAKVGAILDAMVEGVVAVDGRDDIVVMNERALAILGLRDRGLGKPLLEVIRNTDLHEVVRATRAANDAHAARHELRVPGVREHVLHVNAVPLALGGEGRGVVLVLHDVTELRRLERMRTEFVANVSHELRTPLTAIQGYLETLLGGGLDDPADAQRFLGIVVRHTERLVRLLNDLTDLSNIELGKVSLHLAPTPLAPVVDSVIAIIQPRADAAGVVVEQALPETLPLVLADHDRLEQVLINLVDNAVKFSTPGGRVTVTAHTTGSAVEVSVIDTGVGIPPADLPRITERFYRVDRARSRDLGGTGLGLAIVKHLVMAHGGQLHVESEVGRGTCVRFTLRIAATM
jgi:two-component system, OmpR family, phosphate regulon sensor histidine kinase PhoR